MDENVQESRVRALLIGRPQSFREDGTQSAMARSLVSRKLWLSQSGLAGDEVADTLHHGGPDKALHLYPQEHYAWWRDRIGEHPLLERHGAFGENITANGMTEDQVCLGDRFRIGGAIIELSHGRQPCWKLDHHFGRNDMVKQIVASGRCGLYFRVLEEGAVGTGDAIIRIGRGDGRWSVAALFAILIAGGHKGQSASLRELAAHPLLAEAWRQRAATLLTHA